MTSRPARRRVATVAVALLGTGVSVMVSAAPASAANESCRSAGILDARDSVTGERTDDPVADIWQTCVSSDGSTLLLTAQMAPYDPPMTDPARQASTSLQWTVVATNIDMGVAEYVVTVLPSRTEVRTKQAHASGGAPVCSDAQPMADEQGLRSAMRTSCFPDAVRLAVKAHLRFDADPGDPSSAVLLDDAGPDAIHNGLSLVDQRYADLRGTTSYLGKPVSANEFGRLGTTERRRYERGIITQSNDLEAMARIVHGPFSDKYRAMAEEAGPLGRPTGDQYQSFSQSSQRFERGSLWSGPSTGPHALLGPIHESYSRDIGPAGYLGLPVTDQLTSFDGIGRYNRFEYGSMYWTPATGAQAVAGPVRDSWERLGAERGVLGYPTTSRTTVTSGGVYNDFQGGSIYWLESTGAREVRGAIRDTWNRLGKDRSALGYPTTDELGTPDARGRFNHFHTGSIYWSPGTGAREVRGAVRDTWARQGWELGPLRLPATDERATPDGRGAHNHFEGGSIYWSPTTGAHVVRGAIRDRWAMVTYRPTYSPGWELGPLGYPVTSESSTPDGRGRYNHFEHGSIYWSPSTYATPVVGAIRDYWARSGWEAGPLGYPVSSETPRPGGTGQQFQRGYLDWDAATGRVTRLF